MSRKSGLWLLVGLLSACSLAACSGAGRRDQLQTPPAAPSSAGGVAPGDYVEELVSSGETRRYRLHIPPTYRPGAALPLVINLHGLNSNAAQQERLSGMSRKADAAGFIAVYPEGLGDPQTWHFGPEEGGAADLQFLRDLIGRMQQRLGVDLARVKGQGVDRFGSVWHPLRYAR